MKSIVIPAEASWLTAEITALNRDRLLATIIIGACLGISGVLLRTATHNPLADAEVAGVNSGAAFGSVIATTLLGAHSGVALLPGALAGGSLAAIITIFCGMRGAGTHSSSLAVQRMVLLGIAVSAMFSAITFITLVLDEAQLSTVLAWLSGRLGGVRLPDLAPALGISAITVPLLVALAPRLDALASDDSVAASVGANPQTLRLLALISAVLLITPCVAAAGPIGFLGLMSAVLAHRLSGINHRRTLPVAATTGALILLIADIIGQALWAPAETPVGIVTALAGVPVLLWSINRLGTKTRTPRARSRLTTTKPRQQKETA